MKIVHLNGYFKEDLGYQENLLTVGQQLLGHQVYLLTSRFEPELESNKFSRIHSHGITYYKDVTVIRIDHFMEIKKNSLVLLKNYYPILDKIKPDIIFFHDISPNMIFGLLYKFLNPKVKLQIDFHSDENNSGKSFIGPLYHFFWKVFFKIFGAKFDKYFSVAPSATEFATKYYGIPQNELILLPLPGDSSVLPNYQRFRNEIRNELGILLNEKVIIHTGKLPQGKKTQLVINSFSKMKNSNFKLLIAGSVTDDYLNQFENSLKNDDRIIYLGWLNPERLRKVFCACDVLLQPGSLSNIFTDAICCGLPVILNNTDQGKLLTSFNNGILLSEVNEEAIFTALEIVFDPLKSKNLKDNSLIAAKYFDFKNIAKISLQ